MLDKLQALEDKYEQLEAQVSDPEIIADRVKWQQLVKAHSDLGDVVQAFREYKKVLSGIEDSKAMLEDKLEPDFKEMVELEIDELEEKKVELENKLKVLLLPKDPNDDKNVVVEIRGGTGGDEAALFAGDLFRMYSRYAERKGWRIEVMEANETDLGGFKEVTFVIEGKGAYSNLKFESGAHRFNGCRPPKAAGAFTPLRQLWQSCQRRGG
ncbi:hypothetical protein N752_30540 [Desulforamulus aquiferis]|nr:hypothetical protein N752_30540 [Desulforamulus aquiferis]